MCCDGAAIAAATLIAYVVRFGLGWFAVNESRDLHLPPYLIASVVWLGALLAAMALNRLYDEDTLFPGGGELARVLRSVIEAVAVFSVFVYFTHSFSVSRSWMGLTALLSTATVVEERLGIRAFLRHQRLRGRLRRPIIIVSGNGSAAGLSSLEEADFRVLARVDPNSLTTYLTKTREVGQAVGDGLSGAAVMVHTSGLDEAEIWRIIVEAGDVGCPVFLDSAVRSVGRERLTVRELEGRIIVKLSPPSLTGFRAAQKRAFDVLVSALLLGLLLPLLALIALLIVITSGRPVLYGQDRVGRGGRVFRMWKFRTMPPDAESETGPVWTAKEDPRRTRIGRVLRRLSLDELPQLWNVLRGHMSLVGPRPERPVFVGQFNEEVPWYRYRHRIRPGITGLAQAQGLRGNTPLDWRVEADNRYIENWSMSLDVKVLIQTLQEIWRGRNAY